MNKATTYPARGGNRRKILVLRLLISFLVLSTVQLKADLSLQRVTLTVADMETSLLFYTQVMGFSLVSQSSYDTPSLRRIFHIRDGATPTLALLDAGPGQPRALALIAGTGYPMKPAEAPQNAPVIVLNSDDLDTVHERALAAGVDVLLPPTPLNDFNGNPYGREAAYMDPDGFRIVVFQND